MNTDEPDKWALYRAARRVLEIQTMLHRWAIEDPHRRFDDLINLVTDPACLLVAWDRVRSNKGARTAVGLTVDRVLAAIRTTAGRSTTPRRGVTSWVEYPGAKGDLVFSTLENLLIRADGAGRRPCAHEPIRRLRGRGPVFWDTRGVTASRAA